MWRADVGVNGETGGLVMTPERKMAEISGEEIPFEILGSTGRVYPLSILLHIFLLQLLYFFFVLPNILVGLS